MKSFGTTQEFADNRQRRWRPIRGSTTAFWRRVCSGACFIPIPSPGCRFRVFFLACVIVAAIYGGMTAKRSILLIQGLPALIALIAVLIAG